MNEDIEELLTTIGNLKAAKKLIADAYDTKIQNYTNDLQVMMQVRDIPTLKVETATAYWQNTTAANIEDWDAVMQYVKKHDAFDILQRRIAPAQLKARLDAGAKIKGASTITVKQFIIRGAKDEG